MIRVITDSTSSIPEAIREELEIRLFSLFVNRDGVEYNEGTMDIDAFYSDIYDMVDNIPTSSQPSIGSVEEAFEDAAKNGDCVLGVFISSKMSGTYESAVRAAKSVASRYPSFKCAIIDSLSNCFDLGWPVIAGAKAAKAGETLSQCAAKVQESIPCTRFIFAPESLRFLEAGGRIGKAAALIGNVLSLSPILTVKDGFTATYAKVRTQKKAMDKMVSIMKEDAQKFGLKNVTVHYIGSSEKAEKWAHEIIEPLIGQKVIVAPASPVIGVHVGPSVGLAYECSSPLPGKLVSEKPEVFAL